MSKKPSAAAAAAAAAQQQLDAPFDERKLRPIHEAIDGGNFKHGVKLLHAAMQKAGKKPVLQALLALCNAYTHQPEEARAILATLPPLPNLDHVTFQTVALVYRALDDVAKLIECYELSLTKAPKDEDTHLHLFFAVCRTHAYANLQTASMKMFTTFKKDKYLVWSAVNMLLQRRDTPAQTGGTDKLMMLIEMMMQRTFGHPTFPRAMQPEELLVLLRVYNRQAKYAEAVKLLESEAGLAFKEKDATEYLRIKAQILRDMAAAAPGATSALRALNDSRVVYTELVEQNNDDWFFLTQYIGGEFSIDEKQEAAGSPATDDAAPAPLSFEERITQLRTFLRELQQKNVVPAGGKKPAGQALKRGPFLADVELEFRLWQRANTASAAGAETSALEDAIVAYFRQFGSKSCFFYDVLAYLDALPQEARVRVADACAAVEAASEVTDTAANVAAIDLNGAPSPKDVAAATEGAQVKRLQLRLSIQQLLRYNATAASGVSSSTPAPAADTLVQSGSSLLDEFLSSAKLSSSLLRVQSERGVGDHFLIMFAHHYYSLFESTLDARYLHDIIVALEVGLAHYSQFNYQFKLWLIRLYMHPAIGAFQRAIQIYRGLDIKQIQHDITSHLMMEDAVRFGHLVHDAIGLGAKLIQWHATADREDASTTQFGYERSNYSKVIEFVDFRERRHASLALYQARVMKVYGGLLALGVPGAAAPEYAKMERDTTNVHAFLAKCRADLFAQYPAITDHSTNASLSSLVPNNDFTILTVCDAKSSSLATKMNRPAPSLMPSSFALPGDELLQPNDDDTNTHAPSTAQLQSLRFYRISIDLLWHMLEQRSEELRTSLAQFREIITDMRLATITDAADAAVAGATFDDRHWRLCFLALDASACMVECGVQNAAFLDGFGTGSADEQQDKLDQHALRWASVQRQCDVLASLVEEAARDIATRLRVTPDAGPDVSTAGREVVHGSTDALVDLPASSTALRDLAQLSQFGLAWLALCVQVWSTSVPNKKSLKKLTKRRGGAANTAAAPDLTPEEEAVVVEPILAARVAIAALVKAVRTAIDSLAALCQPLAARVAPAKSKAGQAAAAVGASGAALAVHTPTIAALQSAEYASVVRDVAQHIAQSHGQAGANIAQLLRAIDAPLQHIKM